MRKNPRALFTHCYAHSLNRAVVNACNHKDIPEARNFFSLLEGVVVFLKGSASRHRTFLNHQREILKTTTSKTASTVALRADEEDDPDQDEETDDEDAGESSKVPSERPLVPGKGISDTRWISRASTLHRFTKAHVIRATLLVLDEVIADKGTDAKARAAALGFKTTIKSPSFILLLVAFRGLLNSVNSVSEYLQKATLDIGSAMSQVAALKKEISTLRSESYWEEVRTESRALAASLDVDLEAAEDEDEASTRKRKISRKIDENPGTQTFLGIVDRIRVQHFHPALDKIVNELDRRFPLALGDFQYLQPKNFQALSAEAGISRLAQNYGLDSDRTVAQWRLFRHTGGISRKTDLKEICASLPEHFEELRLLYQIFLSLPITTASVERGFSKLALVKNKLRTTMRLSI